MTNEVKEISVEEAQKIAEKAVTEYNNSEDTDIGFVFGERGKDFAFCYVFSLNLDLPDFVPFYAIGFPSYCLVDKNTGKARIDNNSEILFAQH